MENDFFYLKLIEFSHTIDTSTLYREKFAMVLRRIAQTIKVIELNKAGIREEKFVEMSCDNMCKKLAKIYHLKYFSPNTTLKPYYE